MPLPLFLATENAHFEAVEVLVKHSVDLTEMETFRSKRRILHIAARVGDLRLFNYLLDLQKEQISMQDSFGNTPLHCAKTAEIVRRLLENGAEIEGENENG